MNAEGRKVQIGQFYDFNKDKIIWAFPRFFNGTDAIDDVAELKVC